MVPIPSISFVHGILFITSTQKTYSNDNKANASEFNIEKSNSKWHKCEFMDICSILILIRLLTEELMLVSQIYIFITNTYEYFTSLDRQCSYALYKKIWDVVIYLYIVILDCKNTVDISTILCV